MDYEAMLAEARSRNGAERDRKNYERIELDKKLEAAKVNVERQFEDLAKFVEKKLGSTMILRAWHTNDYRAYFVNCVYSTFDCDSGNTAPDGFELAFGIVNDKINLTYKTGSAPGHGEGEKMDRTLRDKCGLAHVLIFDIIEPVESRLASARNRADVDAGDPRFLTD